MKETYYFPHDYNARNDEKIIKLQNKLGLEAVAIYWFLIEMLYEAGGQLELDYELLTFNMRLESKRIAFVKRIINEFNLFQIAEKKFTNRRVINTLKFRKTKSEKARKSANIKWNKHYANAERTQSERYAIKERKGKEILNYKNLKKPYKNYMLVECKDKTIARRYFGKWIDDRDVNVVLDLEHYKELI